MAEHLAQHLIDLGHRSLGSYSGPKLSLHHSKGRLRIRPLVVVLQERASVELVVVPSPVPKPVIEPMPLGANRVFLEGNVSRTTDRLNRPQVALPGVRFIGANLVHGEMLRCLFNQGRKLSAVVGLSGCGFNRRNNVGLGADHNVRLDPCLLAPLFAPLVVEPSGVGGGCKARAVRCEFSLDSLHRQGATLNEGLEDGGKLRAFQIPERAGEGRGLVEKPFSLCLSNFRHCPPAGHRGIDLKPNAEKHVRNREFWTAHFQGVVVV